MLPSRTALDIVNIHASCVAAGNGGVLILGQSGQGKSDLALRLIDRGARLVADDRCDVWHERGRLWCRPPGPLAGKIEVRGIGIVEQPWTAPVPLALRSEEHTSELQSLMRISYAVFCLKKKTTHT